jgi:hypothetical protein
VQQCCLKECRIGAGNETRLNRQRKSDLDGQDLTRDRNFSKAQGIAEAASACSRIRSGSSGTVPDRCGCRR